MEVYRGPGDKAPLFLSAAIHEGEWSALESGHFTPCSQRIRGLASPRVDLDVVTNDKNACLYLESNSYRPSRSLLGSSLLLEKTENKEGKSKNKIKISIYENKFLITK
jgi:hypothetical protein